MFMRTLSILSLAALYIVTSSIDEDSAISASAQIGSGIDRGPNSTLERSKRAEARRALNPRYTKGAYIPLPARPSGQNGGVVSSVPPRIDISDFQRSFTEVAYDGWSDNEQKRFVVALLGVARYNYCLRTGFYVRGMARQYKRPEKVAMKPHQCYEYPRFLNITRKAADHVFNTGYIAQPTPNVTYRGPLNVFYAEASRRNKHFGQPGNLMGFIMLAADGGAAVDGMTAFEISQAFNEILKRGGMP